MKTAFAYWENRIAPVFDIARRIRIVESEEDRVIGESEELLEDGSPVRKVINLAQLDVATLVCGAISRQLQEMVMSNGIQVIPFIAGDLGEVTRAWLEGTLEHERFAMPGCCRKRRVFEQGSCFQGEERIMAWGRGGRQGGQDGQGRGSRSRGVPSTGTAPGFCVCVTCGYREPHSRGIPCVQKRCPSCGSALTRE